MLNKGFNLELTEEQVDALKELGNIGSGNATTAISNLLGKKIEVSITNVKIFPFWAITKIIENPNLEVFAISSNVEGIESMAILQFFPKKSIINLIKDLSESSLKDLTSIRELNDLDDYPKSIISEFGNILAGHYASSMANLIGIKLILKSPLIVLDTFGTVLNSIAAEFATFFNDLVIIKTKIEIDILELEGILLFIPDLDGMEKIFKALNLKFDINLLKNE